MKTKVLISKSTNPYHNLAIEKQLLETLKQDEIILYLWQNEKTVVIGRNQNAWQEVNISALQKDQGHCARRLSGGGAVFHDLGNLNFTFLVPKHAYDISKQLSVLIQALRSFGLDAQKSGRNDLEIEGCKFSGNAYYQIQQACYHHGTLLVNVDMEALSKYLNVSQEKLKAKGVASVRSRVKNLHDFCFDITIDSMKQACMKAFEEIYGAYEMIHSDMLDQAQLTKDEKMFQSWEWLYGAALPFEHEMKKRFAWGEITFQLHVNKGVIEDLNIYSDSLYPDEIALLYEDFKGCRYEEKAMIQRIHEHLFKEDIIALICEKMEEGYD